MAIVLGLDSATEACSAAILQDGYVTAHRCETLQRGHAERLMPLVRAVMVEANIRFTDLDLIAATVGPGGFTGLRIGLASARGLALAAKRPLIGVTTLEAIARAQPARDIPLLVALDTKRADIYLQTFDPEGLPLTEPAALMPPDIANLLPDGPIAVVGTACERAIVAFAKTQRAHVITEAPKLPDAGIVAAIGHERYASLSDTVLRPLKPLYLRPPDARLPDTGSP